MADRADHLRSQPKVILLPMPHGEQRHARAQCEDLKNGKGNEIRFSCRKSLGQRGSPSARSASLYTECKWFLADTDKMERRHSRNDFVSSPYVSDRRDAG